MLKLEQKNDLTEKLIEKKTFCVDNHIICSSISHGLIKSLQNLGFSEMDVTDGDPRVRMQHLFSKKSLSTLEREDGDSLFKQCQSLIQKDTSFVGYIEEEIIIVDESFSSLLFHEKNWSDTLLPVNPSACPEGIYKACDIHLSLHNFNPKVEQMLLAAGFYYLELNKPDLGKVRIYTMQTQDIKTGKSIFDNVKNTIEKGGGVQGSLKFEKTKNLYNQGFTLPPIVLS